VSSVSRRVDHLASAHLELLTGLKIVSFHANNTLANLHKTFDSNAACNVCSVEARRASESRHIAGVIDLSVVVGQTADKCVTSETRRRAQHLPAAQVTVVGHSGRTASRVAEDVVKQHPGAYIEALDDGLRQGVEKTHGLDEVGCDALKQQPAFNERFTYESEVELFEIPDAAVHKLRRPARGSTRPVASLEHADAQAARHSVECCTRSNDSAANNKNVEFFGAKGRDGGLPLFSSQLV